jgi:hypothetical protein
MAAKEVRAVATEAKTHRPATGVADLAAHRLIDRDATAAIYGWHWRTLLRYADMGLVPPGVKIGGSRRWDEAVVRQHIADGCPRVRTIGAK